jgi:stage II sporulation protein D
VPRPSLVVSGRGFGHGVGMSQWGALAMAQRGHSHVQILSHYYRGTRLSLDAGR